MRDMFDPFHRRYALRSLLFDEDHDIDIIQDCLLPLDDINDDGLHSVSSPKHGSWLVRIRGRSPIVPGWCQSTVLTNHKITVMEHCWPHSPSDSSSLRFWRKTNPISTVH